MSRPSLLSLYNEGLAHNSERTAVVFEDDDDDGRSLRSAAAAGRKSSSSFMTYSQLDADSETIADLLRSFSIENHHIVGCVSEPNLSVPCIIIGILKVSSAFFFIEFTNSMTQSLIKTGVKYILASNNIKVEQAFIKLGFICKSVEPTLQLHCGQVNLYELSEVESKTYHFPNWELAYVVQTSGTTSIFPKLIKVPHRCIVPNVNHFRDVYRVRSSDVVFVASPLTFDPSVVDIFMAFASGASVLLVSEQIKMSPRRLASVLIESSKVTMIQATPSLMKRFGTNVLKNEILGPNSSVRILGFGGEECPTLFTLQMWKSLENTTELYNVYGISEVSSWATIHRILFPDRVSDEDVCDVPLGKAIPGTVLLVLDENGREVVEEGEGQLFIGGSERVCFVGFEDYDDVRKSPLRGTGDLVRIDNRGRMFYLNRIDDQIKRNGKRVSLNQIEKIASSVGSFVHDTKAIWDQTKEKLVLAAVVDSDYLYKREEVVGKIRNYLSLFGSSIFLPEIVIAIEKLPITSNGKVDNRKLLSMAYAQSCAGVNHLYSENVIETLSQFWKLHLGVEHELKGTDSFIAFGGNSVKAVVFCEEMQHVLGCTFARLIDAVLNGTFDDVCRCLLSDVVDKAKEASDAENSIIYYDRINDSSKNVIFRGSNWRNLLNTNTFQTTKEMQSKQKEKKLFFSFLWKYDMHKCVDASPLITCFDETWSVYIGSHSNVFVNIDLQSGLEKWLFKAADRIESSACSSSCGKYIFIGSYDRHLYCLDGKSGELYWKFETDGMVKSSPVVDPVIRQVYFGSHDHSVFALNIETGIKCWSLKPGCGSVFSSPCISILPHRLYVGTLDGKFCALCPISGQLLWFYDCLMPVFSSPCLVPEGICVGCVDGTLYCFNYNGIKLWKFKTEGPIFSSCCFTFKMSNSTGGSSAPLVLFSSHDCNVYCLFSINGRICWCCKLDSAVYSTPFVHNYVAYVCSTKGNLYALCVESGSVIGQFTFPGMVFSSPVVVENKLVVGCRDNYLYCLKIDQT